ncbi:hypothetical protein BBJ28_00007885 [Nothophytophthora sp. Chile5]|nr:hypothetical protein BBJ28_00007885 [Nothophytophthora sp. Chile5]
MLLRIAVFGAPAPIGRILAPISAILHIPALVVYTAGIRLEFAKLLLQTFEFWFALVTNTIWLVVFSVVLGDLRVLLVAVSGLNFASSLLQETYLRDSLVIVGLAMIEALCLVLLMTAVSVELLDEVQHYSLVSTRHHELSTKDVLVNIIGTMITLMMRTMYRRFLQFKHQKENPGTAVQSLGYHCRITLAPTASSTTGSNSILPRPIGPLPQTKTKQTEMKATSQHPPLQMHLVPDPERFDARNTIWPRFGSLKPLPTLHRIGLYLCGATGLVSYSLSLLLPRSCRSCRTDVIAVMGLTTTGVVCGLHLCCCQRQLLKRVLTSFDYWFLTCQVLAAHLCLFDVFYWRWPSACGVIASLLWGHWTLTVDALTPSMKRRLGVKAWMPTCTILVFMAVQLLLMLALLVWDDSDLQDRVVWDSQILGRQVRFQVVPFLLSRLFTIFVWCSRLLYALVTRKSDNTLMLLHGNVQYDYQHWKLQMKSANTSAIGANETDPQRPQR